MLGGVTVLVWRLEIMVQSVQTTRKGEADQSWVSYKASTQRVLDICHGRCQVLQLSPSLLALFKLRLLSIFGVSVSRSAFLNVLSAHLKLRQYMIKVETDSFTTSAHHGHG
jgi:hypothetical protein